MNIRKKLENIIDDYRAVVQVFGEDDRDVDERGYGRFVHLAREKLQRHIAEQLVRATWAHVGGDAEVLDINARKIAIPIQQSYIDRIKEPEAAEHVRQNIDEYVYRPAVDKQVFIGGQFVIGIECKAYTENATLKRILVDFDLLKTQHPDLSCYLFQLESQLGGDYSAMTKPTYGSYSTHTIQSYFSCDLHIVTLLAGERNINRPIHKHFKPLKIESLQNAVDILADDMRRFL